MSTKFFRLHLSRTLFRSIMILAILVTSLGMPQPVRAAAILTIEPITWNVVGLDSNNVLDGPNDFPVGVRVCNVGDAPATDVSSEFYWDDAVYSGYYTSSVNAHPYINLRDGTLRRFTPGNGYSIPSLTAGECTDFYYEILISRDSNAYNQTRGYHITAWSDEVTTPVSTPTPREMYIEHLVSQSRNSVTRVDIADDVAGLPGTYYTIYNGIPTTQAISLQVGREYWFKLYGTTATNGYEQIETFINLPNVIFQVEKVETTYTAESSSNMTPVGTNDEGDYYDRLYGDACLWENDPGSANYLECLSTGKAGGDITVSYKIKVLTIPSTDIIDLNSLIYDYSGSSFHYNADSSSSPLYVHIVDNDSVFSKDFKPDTILPGSNSTLTFTITNPGATTLTNVHFTDPLPSTPAQVSVANPANASTQGCGSPTFAPTPGATSLTFSNGTILPYGICSLEVDVTASRIPTDPDYLDVYHNVSGHLLYEKDGDPNFDSGLVAMDDLKVILPFDKPDTCTVPTQLAQWNFDNAGAPSVPSSLNPVENPFVSGNPLLTNASLTGNTGSSGLDTSRFISSPNSWQGTGGWPLETDAIPTSVTTPHFDFQVDTRSYSFARIAFQIYIDDFGDWAAANNTVYIFTSTDGGATFTPADPAFQVITKGAWNDIGPFIAQTGTTDNTGIANTIFRFTVQGVGPGPTMQDASHVHLDDVTITGCGNQAFPALEKSFAPDPIAVQDGVNTPDVSTLTFTVHNPNTISTLEGVAFSDTLPSGMKIATPANLTAPACSIGSISGQTISAAADTTTISMSGASLTPGATCTFSVDVVGTSPGNKENTSEYITHEFNGVTILPPSDYPGASAHDTLTIYRPPLLSKGFSPEYILSGGTSTLVFIISNPNAINTLTGIYFTDTYPAGVVNTDPLTITGNTCGVTPVETPDGSSITISGLDLPANAECSFGVNVTAVTTLESEAFVNNTTVYSTGTSGTTGAVDPDFPLTGNTASDTLFAESETPALVLNKQISVESPAGSGSYSTWLKSVTAPAGANIKYLFTVENVGNVDLTSIRITDPDFQAKVDACTFPPTLYGTLSASEPSFATCEISGITAGTVAVPFVNTATAYGTYDSSEYSSEISSAEYKNGTTPTPVTLSYFRATRKGMDVNFEWSTSTETTNAGFNLYVDDAGSMILINSSLVASNSISSLDQQDYAFIAQVAGNSFFIEDVSLEGETKLHGPYQLGRKYGDQVTANNIDWASILSEHNGKSEKRQDMIKKLFNIPDVLIELADRATSFLNNRAGSNGSAPSLVEAFRSMGRVFNRGERIKNDPSSEPAAASTKGSTIQSTSNGSITSFLKLLVRGDKFKNSPARKPTSTPTPVPTNMPLPTSTPEPTPVPEPTLPPPTYAFPTPVDQSSLLLDNTVNFKVNQTGIQHVTFESLQAAGLDLSDVPTSSITIINRDMMVPVYIFTPASDGTFAPAGYLEFYGQALDTLYTDTNIYTLQVSSAPTSQVTAMDASPDPGSNSPGSFLDVLTVNNQKAYADYAPGSDPWYDTYMLTYTAPKTWDFPFQFVTLADSSAPAELDLVVWGGTSWSAVAPDHHLQVSINGVLLADQMFDARVEKTIHVSIPAGTLLKGTNDLQLTIPGDTGVNYEIVLMDSFKITYQRSFEAWNGNLAFTSNGESFNITGLPSADLNIYRIHDGGMALLNNLSIQPVGSAFTASLAGTGDADTYLLTSPAGWIIPQIEAVEPVAGLDTPAEYLVISHPDFIDLLAPLTSARLAQGLSVNVVDVNDLYTRYNYGIFDPSAIQQYIKYAYNDLGTKYVLLVGGDTIDYRSYLGSSISFIPSLYIETAPETRFVPSDPLFADVNSDNIPDLAIGRFPVRTTAELQMVITKTLDYSAKDYGKTAVFAADKFDGIVSFKETNASLQTGLPADWSIQNINLDDQVVSLAKQQLLTAMNQGTALVVYNGHSGPKFWTFDQLFTTDDASALTNSGKPFLVVQWGCWNTYTLDPTRENLAQSLLFSGDKGAAVVMGAMGRADSNSEYQLGLLLTPRMTTQGMTIGQALFESKQILGQSNPEKLDVLLGWSLLGDPAVVVSP